VVVAAALALLIVGAAAPGAAAGGGAAASAIPAVVQPGNDFRVQRLVSNARGVAPVRDRNLLAPWGMSFAPTSPVWVSDNGSGVATLYAGTASHPNQLAIVPLVVGIPRGAPTGQVFNPSSDFVVSDGVNSGPALFIFASRSGRISGWSPAVPPPPLSTQAQVGVSRPNAVYTGLAITTGAGGDFLFAANFAQRRIDVFDGGWNLQNSPGAFVDRNVPAGFAPYNIQNLGGVLYVTYARRATGNSAVPGAGRGFVDVFDVRGNLLNRLVRRGRLDAPWGLQIAPAGFGRFGGSLLVGNTGDGRINAYSPVTGRLIGTLRSGNGQIRIGGLHGLLFGNGTAGRRMTLLFTAGKGRNSRLGAIMVAP